MSQHDPLYDHDQQQRAQEQGAPRSPYVGAPVRILCRCDDSDLLAREALVMHEEGYLGVITYFWAGKDNPWRVDFGDEYLYLTPDEFEVLS